MKNTKLIATVLVAGMLLTGCGFGSGKAIIKINDQVITKGEYDAAMEKQISSSPFAKMGSEVKANKDGMLYLMSEKTVINHLIVKKIFDEEIKNRGIKVTDKEINDSISNIIDKVGSKEQLSKILKQNGISIKDFKEDVANQVRLQKLAREIVDSSVSDKEVKDFYDKNKQMFTHKDLIRASHILIAANRAQLEQEIIGNGKKQMKKEDIDRRVAELYKENKELAEKLATELRADASKFESYAKKYSKDEFSANRGGDLGYFDKDRMVPEFSKAAFSAKPNTVVGPVETPFGLHIILVTDRKAAGTDSFDKVKSDIKTRLQTEKEVKALDNVVEAAKKKSDIKFLDKRYNPEEIDKKLNEQMQGLQNAVKNSAKK